MKTRKLSPRFLATLTREKQKMAHTRHARFACVCVCRDPLLLAHSSFSLLLTYKLIKKLKKDESFLLQHTAHTYTTTTESKKMKIDERGKFIVNSICDISP